MRRTAFIIGLMLLLLPGCDLFGDDEIEPPEPPGLLRVDRILFTADNPRSNEPQVVEARRTEAGEFKLVGRFAFPPNPYVDPDWYQVRLQMYHDGEEVTQALGDERRLLRYAVDDTLADHVRVRGAGCTAAKPLASNRTVSRGASYAVVGPVSRTSPCSPPGFVVMRGDSTEVGGTLRLVLESYESQEARERGEVPVRTHFDVRVPVRLLGGASAP